MRRVLLAAFATLAAVPAAAGATPRYHLTNLGTLGGPTSEARAINDAGEVVGVADVGPARHHAFWWSLGDATIHNLGTLGGDNSEADAINRAGVITGGADRADGRFDGFRGTPGALEDLGTTGVCPFIGPFFSVGLGIDDAGTVVGVSDVPCSEDPMSVIAPPGHGFRQTAVVNSIAPDINDRGQIALDGGGYDYPPQIEQPDGRPIDVPAAHVLALNDAGQATGSTNPVGTDRHHAYLFDTRTRALTDLGALGGSATGLALNERGDVTGSSDAGAFVALAGQPLQPLSALLDADSSAWSAQSGEGINLAGVIVGQGEIHGQTHAFVAQPVADLHIRLTGTRSPILAGDTTVVTATVTNDGPSQIGDVHAAFSQSGSGSLVAESTSADCFTSANGAGCDLHLLAPGESQRILLTLTAPDAGVLRVRGTVLDEAWDPRPQNDTDAARIRVKPR